MATYTQNMQLKKPAGSDYVQVDDLNGNMDTIDGAVGKLTDLTTTDKTTLVAAINEAAKSGGSENVPYIGDNGNWYVYDPSTMQFKDSGKPSQGDSATVAVGTTTTGAAGTNASVANSGTGSAAVLNFTIPRGDKGEKGDKGDTGTGLTILGTYATLSALQAAVTNPNVGDMYNVGSSAPYNIYLWDGSTWKDQGQLQGAKGDKGDPGTAATVSVGTVSTGAPGSNAAVTNSGTESAAVFNFTIPRGNDGASGVTPNVKAGTTTTLSAGSSATVTRRAGSPDSAPIFDFGIPKGDKGDGADITIDAAMSSTSTNPVQNAVITAALNGKANTAHTHAASDVVSGTLPLIRGGTGASNADAARDNLLVPKRWNSLWEGVFTSGSITVPSVWNYFELLIFIQGESLWEPMYCTKMDSRLFLGSGASEFVYTDASGLFQRHFSIRLLGNAGDDDTLSYDYIVSAILGGTRNGATSDSKWAIRRIYGAVLGSDVTI